MLQDQKIEGLQNKVKKLEGLKKLRDEFRPGGARRQHILDKAVIYCRLFGQHKGLQNDKMHFCLNNLEMSMPEYLTALDKASAAGSNGEGSASTAFRMLI